HPRSSYYVRCSVTHTRALKQTNNMKQNSMTKDHDLSHVKYCMSGAAPLSGELVQELRKIMPNASIGQGYGWFKVLPVSNLLSLTSDRSYGDMHNSVYLLSPSNNRHHWQCRPADLWRCCKNHQTRRLVGKGR